MSINNRALEGRINQLSNRVDDLVVGSGSSEGHNSLGGLQGGSSSQRYHLTQTQHDTLTDGSNADSLHTHESLVDNPDFQDVYDNGTSGPQTITLDGTREGLALVTTSGVLSEDTPVLIIRRDGLTSAIGPGVLLQNTAEPTVSISQFSPALGLQGRSRYPEDIINVISSSYILQNTEWIYLFGEPYHFPTLSICQKLDFFDGLVVWEWENLATGPMLFQDGIYGYSSYGLRLGPLDFDSNPGLESSQAIITAATDRVSGRGMNLKICAGDSRSEIDWPDGGDLFLYGGAGYALNEGRSHLRLYGSSVEQGGNVELNVGTGSVQAGYMYLGASAEAIHYGSSTTLHSIYGYHDQNLTFTDTNHTISIKNATSTGRNLYIHAGNASSNYDAGWLYLDPGTRVSGTDGQVVIGGNSGASYITYNGTARYGGYRSVFNSSVYFMDQVRLGGNVGIGKEPTTALDVNGTVIASGITTPLITISNPTSGSLYINNPSTEQFCSADVYLTSHGVNSYQSIRLGAADGTTLVSQVVFMAYNEYGYLSSVGTVAAGDGTGHIYIGGGYAGTSTPSIAVNLTTDNVGIKKYNPATALDVNGVVTASGFIGPMTPLGLTPSGVVFIGTDGLLTEHQSRFKWTDDISTLTVGNNTDTVGALHIGDGAANIIWGIDGGAGGTLTFNAWGSMVGSSMVLFGAGDRNSVALGCANQISLSSTVSIQDRATDAGAQTRLAIRAGLYQNERPLTEWQSYSGDILARITADGGLIAASGILGSTSTTNTPLSLYSSSTASSMIQMNMSGEVATLLSINPYNHTFAISRPTGEAYVNIGASDNSNAGLKFSGAGVRGTFKTDGSYNWSLEPNDTYATGHIFLCSLPSRTGHITFGSESNTAYKYNFCGSPVGTVFIGATPTNVTNGDMIFYAATGSCSGTIYPFYGAATASGAISGYIRNYMNSGSIGDAIWTASTEISGGDPQSVYVVSGAVAWTVGVDNSDSDKFKIGPNSVGTSSVLIIDTIGHSGFGALDGSAKVFINDSSASARFGDASAQVPGAPGFGIQAVNYPVTQMEPLWLAASGLNLYSTEILQDSSVHNLNITDRARNVSGMIWQKHIVSDGSTLRNSTDDIYRDSTYCYFVGEQEITRIAHSRLGAYGPYTSGKITFSTFNTNVEFQELEEKLVISDNATSIYKRSGHVAGLTFVNKGLTVNDWPIMAFQAGESSTPAAHLTPSIISQISFAILNSAPQEITRIETYSDGSGGGLFDGELRFYTQNYSVGQPVKRMILNPWGQFGFNTDTLTSTTIDVVAASGVFADILRLKNSTGTDVMSVSTAGVITASGLYGHDDTSLTINSDTGQSIAFYIGHAEEIECGSFYSTGKLSLNHGLEINGNFDIADLDSQQLRIVNGGQVSWSNSPFNCNSVDVGLGRYAEAVLKVTDGSTGLGSIVAENIIASGLTLLASGLFEDLTVYDATGTTTCVIRAGATQGTDPVQEWKNYAGTTQAQVSVGDGSFYTNGAVRAGTIGIGSATTTRWWWLESAGPGNPLLVNGPQSDSDTMLRITGTKFAINWHAGTAGELAALQVHGVEATVPTILARGYTGQTAELLKLQDSNGDNKFFVSPTGITTASGILQVLRSGPVTSPAATGDIIVTGTTDSPGSLYLAYGGNPSDGAVCGSINFGHIQYWNDPCGAKITSIYRTGSGGYASNDILFWTRPTGIGVSLAEVMRVTYTGRVGIGQSNPDATLDIVTASGITGLQVNSTLGSAYGAEINMGASCAGEALHVYHASGSTSFPIASFQSGGSGSIQAIANDGQGSIVLALPHATGSTSTSGVLKLSSCVGNANHSYIKVGGDAGLGLTFATTSAAGFAKERIFIGGYTGYEGMTGIGTSTPHQFVDVRGTLAASGLDIHGGADFFVGYPAYPDTYKFYITQGGTGVVNIGAIESGTYKILNIDASTLRLNYNSGGSVGIGGVASPSGKLHIYDLVDADLALYLQNAGTGTSSTATLRIVNNVGNQASMGISGSAKSAYGMIGSDEVYIYTASSALNLMAETAGTTIKFAAGKNTEVCRITSSGLHVGGTVIVDPNTVPTTGLWLDIDGPVSPGKVDSHDIMWTARHLDGAIPHQTDWRMFADAADNEGVSYFKLQWRIDYGTWQTYLQVKSDGVISDFDLPHNSLTDFQGGTANEYYHLTAAQYGSTGVNQEWDRGFTFTTASQSILGADGAGGHPDGYDVTLQAGTGATLTGDPETPDGDGGDTYIRGGTKGSGGTGPDGEYGSVIIADRAESVYIGAVGGTTTIYGTLNVSGTITAYTADSVGAAVDTEVVYMTTTNDTVGKADATQVSTGLFFGIVTDSGAGTIAISGTVSAKFAGGLTLTCGDRVYLSKTAGSLTNDVTGFTSGNVVQEVGIITNKSSDVLATILIQPKAAVVL